MNLGSQDAVEKARRAARPAEERRPLAETDAAPWGGSSPEVE